MDIDNLIERVSKNKKRKFTVEKRNGDYIFVSIRKTNKTLGSDLSNELKIIRKIKNKQQKKSRRINR